MSLLPRSLNASQLAAVARLFSSNILREMARKGMSPIFARLVAESKLANTIAQTEPVRNLFDMAFSLLKRKDYRHEYIYKAAITHKVLLGTHSLRTAAMLSEFRVGGCKADVAILNGTSTVYEIKSERDKLDRLQAQISAYRQVFAKINIITGENHVNAVLASVPTDVGVLLLTDNFRISTIREAADNPGRVIPEAIFDSIQLHESKRILESLSIDIPEAPNTQMHKVLREKFVNLEAHQAHAGMVRVLKDTRSLLPLSELIGALPSSLQAAALSTSLRQRDHARLVTAMDTPIQVAINWE